MRSRACHVILGGPMRPAPMVAATRSLLATLLVISSPHRAASPLVKMSEDQLIFTDVTAAAVDAKGQATEPSRSGQVTEPVRPFYPDFVPARADEAMAVAGP